MKPQPSTNPPAQSDPIHLGTPEGRMAELRRAVQAAAEQLAQGETEAERVERFAARTVQLARTVQSGPDGPERIGVRNALSFHVKSGIEQPDYYAWPIERVRGIARVVKITPVPSVPHYYRGVVNWRGQVLSALDLNVYFGQSAQDEMPPWLIVIGDARLEIGVLADDVFDVVPIRADELSNLDDPGANLLNGVTISGLGLLDADRLLSREWDRIHTRRTNRN